MRSAAAEYAQAESAAGRAGDAGDGPRQAGLFLVLLTATMAGMGACYLILWRPLLSAWR
jgi:hypothetical protein